jgi:hypothetical protein
MVAAALSTAAKPFPATHRHASLGSFLRRVFSLSAISAVRQARQNASDVDDSIAGRSTSSIDPAFRPQRRGSSLSPSIDAAALHRPRRLAVGTGATPAAAPGYAVGGRRLWGKFLLSPVGRDRRKAG